MTDRSPSFAMAHGWHRGHHSSFIERHCGLAKLPDFMVPGFSKALGGCHISGNPGELAECTSISQHLVFENLRHLHFGAKIPWLDGQNYIVSNSFCGNTFSRGAGNSHDFFLKKLVSNPPLKFRAGDSKSSTKSFNWAWLRVNMLDPTIW